MPMDDKESEHRGRAIVQSLAVIVQSMVQPIDAVPPAYSVRTKFEAFRAPNISIRDYLMRINKYASCSPECFVLALVYIDRLHQMQGLTLTELNVHRVLITSVVLAAKFFDDHYFNNAYYSKVGGVPCSEMNELEVEFLLMTNFTLHVSTDVYVRYYNELANHYVSSGLHNGSPVPQFRPYVVMDPEQQGQLIYVAEGELTEPPLPACEELYEQEQEQAVQQQQEAAMQQQEQYERQQYEQQQQQYQQHYEPQLQATTAAYVFQQPQKSLASTFTNGHHTESTQGHLQEQQHQAPSRPIYAYEQQQQQHADPYRHEKQVGYGQQHAYDQYQQAPRGPGHVYQPTHVTNPYASTKHVVTAYPHVQFQPPQPHHQYNHHQYNHHYHSHTHRSSIEDGADPDQSSSTATAAMTGKYSSGLPPAPVTSVSSSSTNGIVYANSGRTSGQKRRKSIALGVNA